MKSTIKSLTVSLLMLICVHSIQAQTQDSTVTITYTTKQFKEQLKKNAEGETCQKDNTLLKDIITQLQSELASYRKDSAAYSHKITVLQQALDKVTEAWHICEATPKTENIIDPNWWKYGLGGAAITAAGFIIYLVYHK